MRERVLMLRAEAPAKPPAGAPCNGCGLCCAWQPCPLGMLASRRRHGRCRMLRWQPEARRYRCGLADHRWGWLRALARRWIAAGQGCDSTLDTGNAG